MLSTEFMDLRGRTMLLSNATLSDKVLFNYKKSNAAVIEVVVNVALSTPQTLLDALKTDLQAWTASDPSTWMPRVEVHSDSLDDDTSLQLRVRCFNRSTWQDRGIIACRSALTMQLRNLMLQHNIAAGDAAPIQLTRS